jgi:hypothetical protein
MKEEYWEYEYEEVRGEGIAQHSRAWYSRV